jgi:hypothetical protein
MDDQEIDEVTAEEEVVEELETDDVDVELNETGEQEETEEQEPEAWMSTGEEEGDELPDVAVGKHIAMKGKLKGRIKDRDNTIDELRAEIEQLKTGPVSTAELPPRPKSEDFDSDEQYEVALDKWHDKRIDARFQSERDKTQTEEATRNYQRAVAKDVDSHYERQAELAAKSGMKPEVFKEADEAVRNMVEAIIPGQGDNITDQIISVIGEGSEKVMVSVGRNRINRLEFQSLMSEDRTGNKALVYLGQLKERLNNPKKLKSTAAKPATNVKGDLSTNQNGAALKKKYDAAHKKGSVQVAYKLKQQAKQDGVDVASW